MSCPRFVQNAWKKDLCSNCFKGKEDHAPVVDNRARYLASLKELTKRPPPQSILKGVIRKNVSALKVHFPTEESQIIGYGGDDEEDNDEEELIHSQENGTVEEDSTEEEDDKNFQRLTESNTEFNKDPVNLSIDGSIKPTDGIKKTSILKLGQAQSAAADGKKQKLLVSVQPFGSPISSTPLAVSRKTHLNNLLHDVADSLKLSNPHDVKQPVPSMTKSDITGDDDKTEKDNLTIVKSVESLDIPLANSVVVDSQSDFNLESIANVEVSKLEENNEDFSKKTEKQAENRLSSLIEGKRNQITRGTILTKSHDPAKSKRYFQLGPVKADEDIPVPQSVLKKLESNDMKSNSNAFSKAKDTISIKTNIQHKNVKNIANGLFSSRLMKKEFGIQSDLQLTRIKSIDYIDSNVSTINVGTGKVNDPMQESKENTPEEIPCLNFSKLLSEEDNVGKMEKDEVLIIDGVPAESREMAGEPDGRADSDDLDEPPPDLPTTPPPLLTDHIPRASFLHNLTKEKPKLPVKPKLREESPPKELVLDHNELDVIPCDPSLSPTSSHHLTTKRQAPKPPPTPLGGSLPEADGTMMSESPPGRRERASSCSPLPSDNSSNSSQTPEPTSRRSLSLSHETLTSSSPIPVILDKKKGNKMRSTLRKFLRLASRDEFRCEELGAPIPPPRPRPEIIHPLDLNKSAVQVLRSDGSLVSSNKIQSNPSDSPSSPTSPLPPGFSGRPNKPPPPPRSQSLDSAMGLDTRPTRPPPPSKDSLISQRLSETSSLTSSNSVYVNLGEVRSSIAPAKPQRSASLREKDNLDPAYQSSTSALQMSENLYESLAPECDSNRERSSLPYYGSETESDIYCPYTFTNSQKGGEELRACKGRTVVHRSLEDNYSAVVVANHEALTQLLEQVNQGPVVPTVLRSLKTSSSLQWTDFAVDSSAGEVVGGRVFLPATWMKTPVTLCLTAGQARLPNCFSPITQFFDLVASQYLHHDKTELVQVSVAVLVRQEFFSLTNFVPQLSTTADLIRESALLMVQIVNNLKTLQAQGREEASIAQFVLCREDKQFSPRVCLLPNDVDKGKDGLSLCQCALKTMDFLSLPQPLSEILRSVLKEERATSLTQAKAALELWLWGPTHVPVSSDAQGNLQRWLDLERANVLQSLAVRRPQNLTCGDYYHLSFLVRTNAKIMTDALSLLDRNSTCTSS